MSKILFFVVTILVASIGAETSTTTGPSTSTTAAAADSHQKPAVISDVQNPSHDSLEDSQAKPAVIAAGSQDHQTNASTHFVLKRESESESQKPAVITTGVSETNKTYDSHFVHKREESQKPAVISAGVSDHQNNTTSNDTHSVQKREESSAKPPVAHDVTFSTLKPVGGVSDSTQRPSDSQQNTGNACVQNYEPVCGSDGKTYSNLCMLGLATQTNPDIVLAKNGEC